MAIVKRVWWIEFKSPPLIALVRPNKKNSGTLASFLSAAYTIADLPEVTL